jgi:hypothetical protein
VRFSYDGKAFSNFNWRTFWSTLRPYDIVLKPGESVTENFMVLYHLTSIEGRPVGEYPSVRPGEFFVDWVLSEGVRSAPVGITVVPAEGKNLEVWGRLREFKVKSQGKTDLLRSLFDGLDDYGLLIQGTVGHPDDHRGDLEKIVSDYPNSTYTPYLAWSFGRYYRQQRMEGQPLASKYLEIASRTNSPSFVREEAMAMWTQVLFDLDQKPKAAEIARQFLAAFPESQHRAEVQHCLNRATAPKPPMEAVEDELRALGYDLSQLSKDEALGSNWFVAVWGTTDQELVDGKITGEQYDLEIARRYKAFIVTNMVPTLTLTNSVPGASTTNSLPSTTNSAPTSSP